MPNYRSTHSAHLNTSLKFNNLTFINRDGWLGYRWGRGKGGEWRRLRRKGERKEGIRVEGRMLRVREKVNEGRRREGLRLRWEEVEVGR